MKLIEVHPDNPQLRLVAEVVDALNDGAVVAYPTSSGYSLGCKLGNNAGIERIRKIRDLQEKQDFTLMCPSISVVSKYAKVNDTVFQILKRDDISAFTLLLKTTTELGKKVLSKRGTVGVRIPAYPAITAILDELGEPLVSTSLLEPNDEDIQNGKLIHQGWSRGLSLQSFSDSDDVAFALRNLIDITVSAGVISNEPTTVVDLTEDEPVIIRQGRGQF